MRVLALEPYYGGSHQAFLDGWMQHSRHAWTPLTLPAFKWKWRMRHAAITFADEVAQRVRSGETWDLVFCSDMLDLAAFRSLSPVGIAALPALVYFHENQFTYPVRFAKERDFHFGFTNLTTALAAHRVWFNSTYHRDQFLHASAEILKKMPDHQPRHVADNVREKAEVWPPGVQPLPARPGRGEIRHPHILWAARWEHDKNPESFFAALEALAEQERPFRVSVIGEQFRERPQIFEWARERFHPYTVRWGYQESRTAYLDALSAADIVASTAQHDFFGLTVVEAVMAGAYPLLPDRLAYPEIFHKPANPHFFYDGTDTDLTERLSCLVERARAGKLWSVGTDAGHRQVLKYRWDRRAPEMDDALEALCGTESGG